MGLFQRLTHGRLVKPEGATPQAVGSDEGPLARMAKFIPGEVVAGYLFFDNTLKSAMPAGSPPAIGSKNFWAAAALVVLCWIVSPLYYLKMEGDAAVKRKHAIMASIAFPAWAYASGGPFVYFGLHYPVFAALGLVAVTLLGLLF